MNLNPEFMRPFFKSNPILYSFRNRNVYILFPAGLSHYSINSVQSRGSLLWNNLPRTVKDSVSVKEFKKKITLCKRFTFLVLLLENFKVFVYYVSRNEIGRWTYY